MAYLISSRPLSCSWKKNGNIFSLNFCDVKIFDNWCYRFHCHCFLGRGGSSSDGGGRGGSGYGAGLDMEVQQDTVFVSNMGTDVTEDLIVQHFGQIGIIKVNISVTIFSIDFDSLKKIN